MEPGDYFTFSVPHSPIDEEAYRDIFQSVGLREPWVVKHSDMPKPRSPEEERTYFYRFADRISKNVGGLPFISMTRRHRDSGLCHNEMDVDFVTFDQHTDLIFYSEPGIFTGVSELAERKLYHNGTFLSARKGQVFIVGSEVPADKWLPLVKRYPPRKIRDVLEADISDKIILSLDIDALKSSLTEAYDYYVHAPIDDMLMVLRKERRSEFSDILDISKQLAEKHQVVGINIAEYNPQRERNRFLGTQGLIKLYLSEILDIISDKEPAREAQTYIKQKGL